MNKNQDNNNPNQDDQINDHISNRKLSIIDTSLRKQKIYYDTIRGDRTQTKQLNIHLKTINQKQLKRCVLANQIEGNDKNVIDQYRKMNANFQSSQYLFRELQPSTKQICKQYIQSSDIVRDVLKSDRMFVNNKIILLKYMKKIQSGIDTPNVSWKQEYFKNKNQKVKEKNKQDAKTPSSMQPEQNAKKLNAGFGQATNMAMNNVQQSKNMRNIHTYGATIFTGIIYPINQTEGILLNQFK